MERTELNNQNENNIFPFPANGSLNIKADNNSVSNKKEKEEIPTPKSDKILEKAKQLDKKSSYPSNYDYETYKRLEQRFGLDQPRGGIVFGTTFKVVNHYEGCTRCHYAFELDTYGRGCTHDCVFCYAKDQLTQRAFWNRPFPMPVDLCEIRKIFYTVFETNKPNKYRAVLEKRIPLRLGSMSDPFLWMDKKYGVTLELIKILNYYKYPWVAFTRSDLVAKDEYLKHIDPRLGSIQFSISGENEELTKKIEPGAPSVKRRLAALKTISNAGINTAVRINPLFPMYPDGYFTNPSVVKEKFGDNIPTFPLLDIDNPSIFLDMIKDAGVRTIIPGVVRLTHREIKRMDTALNMPFRDFFTYGHVKGALNVNFSDKEISYYYLKLHKEALKKGLRFTTCYIGNGVKDYFQYQDLWDNKKDCCDIVGKIESFDKTSQNIPWEERMKYATCKPSALTSMKIDQGMEDMFTTLKNNKDNEQNSQTVTPDL